MKQVGEVAVQPRVERSAFGRWRALAGLVGVLALACGLWWWSHPTVLSSRAQGSTLEAAPRPVAQAELHVGVSLPPVRGSHAEVLTFDSVAAHFADNSAGARATFSVCVRRPQADVLGATSDPLTDFCSQIEVIEPGTRLNWVSGYPAKEYVVMTLVPSRAGRAHVDTVVFDYGRSWRYLFQRGSDRATQDWTLHAT